MTRLSLCLLFVLPLIWLQGCRTLPPADSSSVKWDAESVDDERSNTHLWLVNRAIDLLSKHSELEGATRIVSRLTQPGCVKSWHQGLIDADFLAAYNGGKRDLQIGASTIQIGLARATWASHFYDPDTGTNYKGETSPTALSEGLRHVKIATSGASAAKADVSSRAESETCYELGLALHYFTDMTQPMHAANFTAVQRPRRLHSSLETYAMTIQARYPAKDWSGAPSGDLKVFFIDTAREAKKMWPGLFQAVMDAYAEAQSTNPVLCGQPEESSWKFLEAQQFDHINCWAGNAVIDQNIGDSLMFAQDRTAQFLYLVEQLMLNHLP